MQDVVELGILCERSDRLTDTVFVAIGDRDASLDVCAGKDDAAVGDIVRHCEMGIGEHLFVPGLGGEARVEQEACRRASRREGSVKETGKRQGDRETSRRQGSVKTEGKCEDRRET